MLHVKWMYWHSPYYELYVLAHIPVHSPFHLEHIDLLDSEQGLPLNLEWMSQYSGRFPYSGPILAISSQAFWPTLTHLSCHLCAWSTMWGLLQDRMLPYTPLDILHVPLAPLDSPLNMSCAPLDIPYASHHTPLNPHNTPLTILTPRPPCDSLQVSMGGACSSKQFRVQHSQAMQSCAKNTCFVWN